MSGLKIAAIPTTYRGRAYRSRLEAKWAAFFDLLGWRAEYEPFDLGSWSPDFLLKSNSGDDDVLVEVKPITVFDAVTATKMETAGLRQPGNKPKLLLLGVAPWWRGDPEISAWLGYWADIGLTPGHYEWGIAAIEWIAEPSHPAFVPDITPDMSGCVVGHLWGNHFREMITVCHYPSHTIELWSKACSAVQWLGKDSQS